MCDVVRCGCGLWAWGAFTAAKERRAHPRPLQRERQANPKLHSIPATLSVWREQCTSSLPFAALPPSARLKQPTPTTCYSPPSRLVQSTAYCAVIVQLDVTAASATSDVQRRGWPCSRLCHPRIPTPNCQIKDAEDACTCRDTQVLMSPRYIA